MIKICIKKIQWCLTSMAFPLTTMFGANLNNNPSIGHEISSTAMCLVHHQCAQSTNTCYKIKKQKIPYASQHTTCKSLLTNDNIMPSQMITNQPDHAIHNAKRMMEHRNMQCNHKQQCLMQYRIVSAYANTERVVDAGVNIKSLHSTYHTRLHRIQDARGLCLPLLSLSQQDETPITSHPWFTASFKRDRT